MCSVLNSEEVKDLIIEALNKRGIIVDRDSLDFLVGLESSTPYSKPRYTFNGCTYSETKNEG